MPPFIFNDERSRVTLPGVDNPAIPPEEWLAQPVGISTTTQKTTKDCRAVGTLRSLSGTLFGLRCSFVLLSPKRT